MAASALQSASDIRSAVVRLHIQAPGDRGGAMSYSQASTSPARMVKGVVRLASSWFTRVWCWAGEPHLHAPLLPFDVGVDPCYTLAAAIQYSISPPAQGG